MKSQNCNKVNSVVIDVTNSEKTDSLLDIITLNGIILGATCVEELGMECYKSSTDWTGPMLTSISETTEEPEIYSDIETLIAFASRFFTQNYIPETWKSLGVTTSDTYESCMAMLKENGFYREHHCKREACIATKQYQGKWIVIYIEEYETCGEKDVEVLILYVDEVAKKKTISFLRTE